MRNLRPSAAFGVFWVRVSASVHECRCHERCRHQEDRLVGDEVPAGAHRGGRHQASGGHETDVAADALAEARMADAEAMAGIAGPSTQLAAACRTPEAITIAKIGHEASASALRPIPTTANPAAVRGERTEFDDGASRHLAGQRDEAADRQDEADLALRPRMGRQIDGDERPEAVCRSATKNVNQSRPRRLRELTLVSSVD